MDYLRIHLADEAPELGSGHRSVLVLSLGPSWAHLLDPSDCQHSKLPREDVRTAKDVLKGYNSLSRRGVALPLEAEKMIKRLVANATATGRWTGIVRDACLALGARLADLPPVEGASTLDTAARPAAGGTGEDTTPTRLEGERVGGFVERQWMSGRRSPEEVVTLAQAAFPGCKVDVSHVKWYASRLRRNGVANVPEFPKAR